MKYVRILRDFVVLILLMRIISCAPKTGSEIVDSAMDEAEAVETEPNTCGTFDDIRYGDDAITAHVLYRDYLKREQYERAFPCWKKAFSIAPAADGKRTTHCTDGVICYE